jgi:hypothetical protein
MKKPRKPAVRRLFFDIETSPNIVLSWRVGWKLSINHDSILQERGIICIAYKWAGERKTHVLTWDENQCDKAMLQAFSKVMEEAEEAVGHNIDRFDLPWVTTRCIKHGLSPLPNVKTADTLQWARRRFNFNSNKLDYIAQFLGLDGKIKTSYGLWKAILLDKCDKSMKAMARYCAYDVILLEKVYERLSAFSPIKSHEGVVAGRDKWSCPNCGSEDVNKVSRRVSAKGHVSQNMKCKDESCGRYFTIPLKAAKQYEDHLKQSG